MKGLKLNYINPEDFDNTYNRKTRGFIIGGGPSILDLMESGFDFKALEGEVTIGINKAYDLLTPTYLVFGDTWFWNHFKEELIELKCTKFCPHNVAKKGVIQKAEHPDVHVVRCDYAQGCHFRDCPDSFKTQVPFWNNSGVFALRIAHILGLHPIYLVGIDIELTDEKDRTHFHTAYKEQRLNSTTVCRYDQFYQAFESTIRKLRKKLIRIYSCSPTSKLNTLIPFKDIKEVL